MKCRNIYDIQLNKKAFKRQPKCLSNKDIIALDTETSDGKCFMIGFYSKDKKHIYRIASFDDFLDLFFKDYFIDSHNFFYNMEYDRNALLKHLPTDLLIALAKDDICEYKEYTITIMGNKIWQIKKKVRNKITILKFYDIAQFYSIGGYLKLDVAAKKYLHLDVGKDNMPFDITNLSPKLYDTSLYYRNILNKYCLRDCELTYFLAKRLIHLANRFIYPQYFYSQASFSQQYYLENLSKNAMLPPKKAMDMALKCYQGGRFEVFKRGYFDDTWRFDIKSAYPDEIRNLPSTDNGYWKYGNEFDDDSIYGIYKCKLYIPPEKCYVSPAKYQLKNGLLCYPIGEFKTIYLCKDEYKYFVDEQHDIKIETCAQYFVKDIEYPFLFIEDLYNKRVNMKKVNDPAELIVKIMMNGFYGKLIQLNINKCVTDNYSDVPEVGRLLNVDIDTQHKLQYTYIKYKSGLLFNPIYANEITARTRVKLMKTIKRKEKHVIAFATDSITTSKPLDLPFSNKLGDWSIEVDNKPQIVIGSGMYGELDGSSKMRGFGRSMSLYEILNEYRKVKKIPVKINMLNKLKKTNKLSFENFPNKWKDFNKIVSSMKYIDINFDTKRLWNRNFNDCNDILNNTIDSKPILL